METKQRERRSEAKQKSAPANRRRSHQARPEQESADVVYQPAMHFSRNRLILSLVTILAVVVALLLGISVFFNVDESKYSVSGCEMYTPQQIWEASGIKNGDNLLTIDVPGAAARIMQELPYIESVRIGIKLPDKVQIEVVESKVVYAVQAADNSWWLVNSGGKVVDQVVDGLHMDYAQLIGVKIQVVAPGDQAMAHEVDSSVATSEADRLETALNIVKYLEQNEVIGGLATVNVTDMGNLEFWYGQQYHVKLGNDADLLYKVSCFKAFLDNPKTDPYESGELDISFTTWPDQIGFTPFEK